MTAPVPRLAEQSFAIPVERCPYCGGTATVGSTCPKAVTCPTCHAGPGSPCKRPSGHACDVHNARTAVAEALDVQNSVIYP
jgi:hypothetical protein